MASYRSRMMSNALKGVKPLVSSFALGDVKRQRRGKELLSLMETTLKDVKFDKLVGDGVKGRWATPEKAVEDKVILFAHGGGYGFNSPDTYSSFLSRIAHRCGMEVFSYYYRLAPENPHPAALEDAVSAFSHLLDEGYQPADIIAMGDSAGGGLSLAMCHYLKDNGMPLPGALVLISPWTDLTLTSKAFPAMENIDPVLSEAALEEAAFNYCGDQDRENPYISPLFGDFKDFPPTLIHVGSDELLIEDAIELDKKMQADGVSSILKVFNGMWHVWHTFDVPEAYQAINMIADFIDNTCNNYGLPPRTIKVGGIYRHFKGRNYKVLTLARDSQNMAQLVVYQQVDCEQNVWTRPIDRFLDRVEVNNAHMYRFTEVENA